MPKFVYDFTEGNKDLKDLLGGKGANLAEMTNIGLPVPPGFTITTDACRYYLANGTTPEGLDDEVAAHLEALEQAMGRKLGDPGDPLLVSVRSGAKFSMPGMMDTVLNIGLSDESVLGLAKQSGNERFAWDAYRRLVQMFGKTVLGVDGEYFEHALDSAKHAKGVASDTQLTAEDLMTLTNVFKDIVVEHAKRDFPQDPREQMDLAIKAVFESWNADRAILYRRQERIPADLGTAVNVVAMVFGNLDNDSGTGVAFTRDPGTGAQGVYGDYLENAQGEDVVAGIRNTVPLQDLERIDKASYDQLMQIMRTLENHYKDLCDIEFTIERRKLWMLQTRVGKRTAAAAFRIATQLVDQGLIDMDEAVSRVSGDELARLMFPRFDTSGDVTQITKAISASPGAAVGEVVFDSATAVAGAERGEHVILVRRETNPDDLPGMIAAQGVLTSRGGKTSHAAVVARGMGKTCVCGAEELNVDTRAKKFTAPGGVVVSEGDVISIDGTSGAVYLGEIPVVASNVVQYFEGTLAPDSDELVAAVHRIMTHADEGRRLGVHANADNGPDCARARRFGATGVGLVRTEHMFLGERRQLVERLILAETGEERQAALDALEPLQRGDFVEILEAMDGLAGDDPADRPAAARVPARPHGPVGQGRAGRRRRHRARPPPPRGGPQAARAEPDARPARRAARAGHPRPARHAGPRHRHRGRTAHRGGPRPQAGDHDPADRDRAGDGDQQGARREGAAGGGGGDRRPRGHPDRHDDRGAAGRPHRGRDRQVRGVLLLRHQRPDADDLGLLQGRRGRGVLQPVHRDGHLRRVAVRDDRRRRRGQARADRHGRGPGYQVRPAHRRLRRARRRPGVGLVLQRGRPRLRVLLAVPRPDRAARGGPGRDCQCRQRH